MTLAERISARPLAQRRALTLGILAAAIALVWFAVLAPTRALLASQGEWRRGVKEQLATRRGKAQLEPRLSAEVAALRAAPLWSAFYIARNDEDAGAQLQREIVTLGTSMGVSGLTLTPLPKVERDEYVAYGVRATGTMSAEQLRKWAEALRAAPYFMRIERLTASAPQIQAPDQNAPLAVAVEVYGYARRETAGADRGAMATHPADR